MLRAVAALMAGLAALPAAAQTVPSTPPPAPPQASPGGMWPPGQVPGYYRFELGDFEVVALLDGTHPFPATELAVGAKPGEVADLLAQNFLTSPVEGGFSAFLVRMPGRLVLIDTGAGDLYGRDGGLLVANMRAAGIAPEQIDEIYLTHLHRDHVGGLLIGGKPVFPRAVVRVARVEADFWLNDANRAKVPAFLGSMFDGAEQCLKPYIAAGRFKPYEDGEALAPGITAISAPGHTPGHHQYLVESRGKALLVWGDTVHVAPVQLPDPHVAMKYDTDPQAAVRSREAAFAAAADKGWWVAGAHLAFPGLGHVRRTAPRSYAWVPANYSLNRLPQ
jgi:glyoxylase-like metal-dependent hydrolase (beta-lactamase superfamily II)